MCLFISVCHISVNYLLTELTEAKVGEVKFKELSLKDLENTNVVDLVGKVSVSCR